eukprot:snap_masked-scaffold_37-processed-gene-2.34-mRNA-1 protein AED:1.00 eAED:1.00 QI:0/0/0/0/1/1/2/0/289
MSEYQAENPNPPGGCLGKFKLFVTALSRSLSRDERSRDRHEQEYLPMLRNLTLPNPNAIAPYGNPPSAPPGSVVTDLSGVIPHYDKQDSGHRANNTHPSKNTVIPQENKRHYKLAKPNATPMYQPFPVLKQEEKKEKPTRFDKSLSSVETTNTTAILRRDKEKLKAMDQKYGFNDSETLVGYKTPPRRSLARILMPFNLSSRRNKLPQQFSNKYSTSTESLALQFAPSGVRKGKPRNQLEDVDVGSPRKKRTSSSKLSRRSIRNKFPTLNRGNRKYKGVTVPEIEYHEF